MSFGVEYSPAAEGDLDEIAAYTKRTWGEEQAELYLDRIEAACDRLANKPQLGRHCDHVRDGLRRMEEGSHVIFFIEKPKGILVVRILHKSMVPEQHLL